MPENNKKNVFQITVTSDRTATTVIDVEAGQVKDVIQGLAVALADSVKTFARKGRAKACLLDLFMMTRSRLLEKLREEGSSE